METSSKKKRQFSRLNVLIIKKKKKSNQLVYFVLTQQQQPNQTRSFYYLDRHPISSKRSTRNSVMENQTQLNEESQSITLDYYLLHRHSRPFF